MQLRTIDGNLTLGSIYKLFVWSWLLSWSVFMGAIFLLLVLVALATGQMAVNGEMVQGRGPALMAMLPMLVLFPIIIVMQAFMFGGFLTFGAWLYRLRRPLKIVPEGSTPSA
jgi:hypothetical protein